MSPTKKESPGYIEDLGEKRKFELKDILQRQNQLLANKNFLSKLSDNGEKIRTFKAKVLKELENRNEIEKAAQLLSKLNIASEGKAAMTSLEWTGKYSENPPEKVIELDSDDDENPLQILAQPTGSGTHKKKVIIIPPEESLIKPEDLEHVKFIINKVEHPSNEGKFVKKTFKPYKTTKSNVHDPEKEKVRKKDKHWEVTAATPPLIVHGAVKILSLNESLTLEKEKTENLQKMQEEYTAQRLAENMARVESTILPDRPGNYRDEKAESESEEEVYDDDDDKGGTVVFQVEQ